jgi:predicted RNA binding protein YcfA (HicA-like mRNA interferase family)
VFLSKVDKLIIKLLSVPADFTWSELKKVLKSFGYEEIQGSGSRVKFIKKGSKEVISLHKPHPKPVVRKYALRQIIEKLNEHGDIENEE